MRSFVSRLARDQRVRFLVVGGINTLIGYGVFSVLQLWVFADIPFGYLASLVLSYAVAICIAFVLYRRFVFPVKGRIVSDFVKFVGVYLVSIGINAVLLPLLAELVGLHPLVAQAISLVLTTLISYFGHKYISFRRRRDAPDTASNSPGDAIDGDVAAREAAARDRSDLLER